MRVNARTDETKQITKDLKMIVSINIEKVVEWKSWQFGNVWIEPDFAFRYNGKVCEFYVGF